MGFHDIAFFAFGWGYLNKVLAQWSGVIELVPLNLSSWVYSTNVYTDILRQLGLDYQEFMLFQ